MTHDELLAEIDQWLFHSQLAKSEPNKAIKVLKALRAVVELHKPRDYKAGNWCIGCNADYEYPCPTIQAIEKELK